MTSPARALVEVAGQIRRIVAFLGYFLWHLVEANLQMAREVLTPRSGLAPGIVRLDLRARSDLEISVFANLVTLTPGTLVVAVRRDPAAAWVHGTHAADPDRFRDSLRTTETRLLAAMRRSPRVGEPPDGGRRPRSSGNGGSA